MSARQMWTRSDEFNEQVISIMKFLKHYDLSEIVEIDLSELNYAPPLISVGVTSQLLRHGVRANYSNSYCRTIGFGTGAMFNNRAECEQFLNTYKSKNYIPIVKFPASKKSTETEIRNLIINSTCDVIRGRLNLDTETIQSFSYLIGELTDNIVDHACSEYGFLSFQYYPTKNYLDLCISDNGQGFTNSYQNNGYPEIQSDTKSLEKALNGYSTKEPKTQRGKGLNTSEKLAIQGFRGNFVLLSGQALYLSSKDKEILDWKCNFSGSLAFFRLRDLSNVELHGFLE